jgi:hypothetical protein
MCVEPDVSGVDELVGPASESLARPVAGMYASSGLLWAADCAPARVGDLGELLVTESNLV